MIKLSSAFLGQDKVQVNRADRTKYQNEFRNAKRAMFTTPRDSGSAGNTQAMDREAINTMISESMREFFNRQTTRPNQVQGREPGLPNHTQENCNLDSEK